MHIVRIVAVVVLAGISAGNPAFISMTRTVDSAEALHSRFRDRLSGAVEATRFEPARSSPPGDLHGIVLLG